MSDVALFQRLFVTWGIIVLLWVFGPGNQLLSGLVGDTSSNSLSPMLDAAIAGVYTAAHVIAIVLSAHWIRKYRTRI